MFQNSVSITKSGVKRREEMTVYMVRYNSRVTKCYTNFFDLNVLKMTFYAHPKFFLTKLDKTFKIP